MRLPGSRAASASTSTPSSAARRRASGLIRSTAGGAAVTVAAACRTSRSTMRPVRPLPVRLTQSTPNSLATRRARGLMVGSCCVPLGGSALLRAACWSASSPVVASIRGFAGSLIRSAIGTDAGAAVQGSSSPSCEQVAQQRAHGHFLARRGRVGRDAEDAAVQRLDLLGGLVPLDGEEESRRPPPARRPVSATRPAGPFPCSSRAGARRLQMACCPPIHFRPSPGDGVDLVRRGAGGEVTPPAARVRPGRCPGRSAPAARRAAGCRARGRKGR